MRGASVTFVSGLQETPAFALPLVSPRSQTLSAGMLLLARLRTDLLTLDVSSSLRATGFRNDLQGLKN